MKYKSLWSIVVVLAFLVACNNDDDGDGGDDFDHAAQALIDEDVIQEYLKTHHYLPPTGDEYFGVIDTIEAGEFVVSLFDDSRLKSHMVTLDDGIDYKLYSYEYEEGSQGIKGTKVDSLLVRFQGVLINQNEQFDRTDFFSWFLLFNSGGFIQGFREGLQYFSGGDNISVAGSPINYTNTGKGFFIFPSGLGYRNNVRNNIPENAPLVFHVDVGDVIIADNDNDGIINRDEDLDGDGEAFDDDSDSDQTPNFVDIDDENDGVATINEDIDGDGNPINDDTDNDGIPNYLDTDDDGDGRLTRDESKTQDQDNDGIVDYLDPDTN